MIRLSLPLSFPQQQCSLRAVIHMSTEKKMHNLKVLCCFTWGKMRTAAWETAPQSAGRDCSKEAVEEGQYVRFW